MRSTIGLYGIWVGVLGRDRHGFMLFTLIRIFAVRVIFSDYEKNNCRRWKNIYHQSIYSDKNLQNRNETHKLGRFNYLLQRELEYSSILLVKAKLDIIVTETQIIPYVGPYRKTSTSAKKVHLRQQSSSIEENALWRSMWDNLSEIDE